MSNQVSLIERTAGRFGLQPAKMVSVLKSTAFRTNEPITDEQLAALLIVSEQYGLSPFTKELYAFPDKGNIIPVVGVDGWSRIINEHPQFDGMDYHQSETMLDSDEHKSCPEWIECAVYRKDRTHPIVVREYLDECYKPPRSNFQGPWQTHTKRMLRHKATIQAARLAFGFAGIYDPDEAERIRDMGEARVIHEQPEPQPSTVDTLKDRLRELDDGAAEREEFIRAMEDPLPIPELPEIPAEESGDD